MDANHHSTPNHNLLTTENKIWLPPSFTNNKAPLVSKQAPTQLKNSYKWRWGFFDKTGWEWLNLVGILLVPLMIGVFTVASAMQNAQINQKQHDTDIQIALDQQQEVTLKAYLDDISNLLLEKNLRASTPSSEVRQVARVKTLTALRRLDPNRKGLLMRFLSEANLIAGLHVVIDLSGADLSGAILTHMNLGAVYLSKLT